MPMSFRRLCAVFVTFAVLAVPSIAAAERYACEIEFERNQGGWVPLSWLFDIDGDQATVVYSFGGQRYQATADVERTGARWTAVFDSEIVRDEEGQGARLLYRATMQLSNRTFRVMVLPLGYSNRFNGRGACVPV